MPVCDLRKLGHPRPETTMNLLPQAVVFLMAACIAVPLSRKSGFGSVLGYLIAGVVIGPWCLQLITGVDAILN